MKYFLYALSGIGTLIWSFAFMIGINYVIDNIAASVVLAILLAALLGGAVWLMVVKSQNRDNVSGNTVKASLAVYILASLASCIFVNQYIYVENVVKDEIRKEANGQIEELRTAYGEDAGSFYEWVYNLKADYRILLEGTIKEGSIDTKVNEIPDYFLDSDYAQRANRINSDLAVISDNLNSMVWTDMAFSLRYLKDNKELWEQQLTMKSKDTSAFGMSLSGDEIYHPVSVHNDFEVYDSLSKIGFSGWSIVVIIVLQFMMLLVYFVIKPDTGRSARRYNGEGVGSLGSWGTLPSVEDEGTNPDDNLDHNL